MENFEPHKREIFWYNISVPHERGDLIFDIGLRTGRRRRHLFRSVCEASGLVRSRIGQNPGSAVLIQSPFRGAAETHPTPAASTQQRIGASEKTTTFTDEAEYGVAPYGNHAAQPLFLCFVQARSGASRKQGFEGAPLFFSASKRQHSVK